MIVIVDMKFVSIICLTFLFIACKPLHLEHQNESSFVCANLVKGYLNLNGLDQSQLISSTQQQNLFFYTYKISTQHTSKALVSPYVEFECKVDATQHYAVQLKDTEKLLLSFYQQL